ncbi:MAG: ATP-grasp domain-containing protein [Paludibacteraceae bacterium]|nr:ATP-grasp domain-containing protein [Paludibacteraceae bacterium]
MNILLTTAGRRSYIVDYFKQCNGVGKVYAANSAYTIALQRADGYMITPLIYDDEYIPSIINYCKENDIRVVLSLFDVDLLVLAKHRSDFEQANIQLILASKEFVEICNDKWKTYEFLIQHGLPSPKTYNTLNGVTEAINNGDISFPLILKPRWGMASLSIYKVEDMDELRVLTKKCEREIFSSYLKYESCMTKDSPIIYQELIAGEEYGLDVLNDLDGNYIKTFAKQKVTMRSGETDLGRTTTSEPFESFAKKIAANSHHEGLLSVDCLKNDNGVFFIEFNCRISGHYPLSYLAGFNYPQIVVDWMNGKGINEHNLQFKEELYIIKDLVPMVLNYPGYRYNEHKIRRLTKLMGGVNNLSLALYERLAA